ncbi:MAG: SEC-C motif-containing protein [Paracoccaceae bacterium]|jgi:SEC-C motif-containing protein
MRSRFAAFACGLAHYVMATTDPEGSAFEPDAAAWERSILAFSMETGFDGLEILEAPGGPREGPGEGPDEGSVTFKAALTRGTGDVSFTEQSRFLRRDGRWFYHSGVIELA